MKVTELNEELIEEIKSTSLYLIRAINFYRNNNEHKFTHVQLGSNMSKPKSQGTIAKILSESNVQKLEDTYGNLSVSEAKELCVAMGTTLGNVLLPQLAKYEEPILMRNQVEVN